MGRISIAGLLGFVAVFAFGLAALVGASNAWVGATFTLSVGLLLTSVLVVILRGRGNGGWPGFALFAWGYFFFGYVAAVDAWLVPDAVTGWVFSKSNSPPIPPAWMATATPGSRAMTPEDSAYYVASEEYNKRSTNAGRIGRWLAVLVFGGAGAVIGVVLALGRQPVEAPPVPPARPEPDELPATVIQEG